MDFYEANIHSFNRYAYANNNPYRYVDPDGNAPALAIWGFTALLTAYDMSTNAPVPGHENDAIRSIVTMPGPVGLGAKSAGAVAGKLTDVAKSGQLGQGLKNVREITSGRLKGFSRGNTALPGGTQGAKDLFKQLTGNKPKGGFDRMVLDDGREVLFRGASRSGPSKIEVVNPNDKFLEKISFPE